MKKCRAIANVSLLVLAFCGYLVAQSVNVTTWHNDIGRTGQNTNETTLTTSNVKPSTFGKLCTHPVVGQIYGKWWVRCIG